MIAQRLHPRVGVIYRAIQPACESLGDALRAVLGMSLPDIGLAFDPLESTSLTSGSLFLDNRGGAFGFFDGKRLAMESGANAKMRDTASGARRGFLRIEQAVNVAEDEVEGDLGDDSIGVFVGLAAEEYESVSWFA